MMTVKSSLQGLEAEDLALLLYGLRAIHVADRVQRCAKLEAKLRAALQAYGISDVKPS